jgi:BirA family biotin operon repressor/biotin-[acetyl-CoA-carboxylase] ligase
MPAVRGLEATDGEQTAAVLELLHAEPLVSGERISERLGISRAAVWKHVEQLRAAGYRIDARRAGGYRLLGNPDRLLPREITRRLATERLGRRIVHWEETDSTNVQAARLAREGAPEGTLVVAERQTRGKGRLGRTWISPPHVNLYASFVLRPTVAPADAPQIGLAAAIAVARALEPLAPGQVAIKWPNDCLLDGRKVAGLLTEMSAELDRVHWVVLGIGVNLNSGTRAFSPEVRRTATSVRLATGHRVDRVAFTASLCGEIESVYDRLLVRGFSSLVDDWQAYSCLSGREVTVDCGGRRITGRVRGLDASGHLVVDGAEGEERIVAGDVSVVGGYAHTAGAR